MNVVSSHEKSSGHFALKPDGRDLAARIIKFIRIIRQQIEVQPVPRELRLVKSPLTGANRNVARGQLARRHGLGIDIHRYAGETSWEAGLGRARRRIGCQSIQSARQIPSDRIRSNLRVIHGVAGANRCAPAGARLPGKSNPRLEILRRSRQRLTVVAQTEVYGQVRQYVKSVLRKSGNQPLTQFVATNSEVDRLRVILYVRQGQLIKGQSAARSGAEKGEGAKNGGARLAADATRGVMHHAAAEPEIVRATRPRQRVGELILMTPEIREARLSNRKWHCAGASVSG